MTAFLRTMSFYLGCAAFLAGFYAALALHSGGQDAAGFDWIDGARVAVLVLAVAVAFVARLLWVISVQCDYLAADDRLGLVFDPIAHRHADIRGVLWAVAADLLLPLIAVLPVAWAFVMIMTAGQEMHQGTNGPASWAQFWADIAHGNLIQSEVAIIAAILTVLVGLFGYLLRLRRTQLNLVSALLVELRLLQEHSAGAAQWDGLTALVGRLPPVRPVVTAAKLGNPLFESQKASLPALPGGLMDVIVRAYQNDSFLTEAFNVLTSDAFAEASALRRKAHIANMQISWTQDHVPAATRAIFVLTLYRRLRGLFPL